MGLSIYIVRGFHLSEAPRGLIYSKIKNFNIKFSFQELHPALLLEVTLMEVLRIVCNVFVLYMYISYLFIGTDII